MDCTRPNETLQNIFVFEDGEFSCCHDRIEGGEIFHKHKSTMELWDCEVDNRPRTAIGSFALYRRGALQFMVSDGKPYRVRDAFHAVGLWLSLSHGAAIFPMVANHKVEAKTKREIVRRAA